ncbi:FHA domain-containing protein At4g14490-like [Lotus japonicus]|uniref:FHA domain-containing protein At4g14490-like n=1 Tax=Lotus japonicus TaxID=34305 RepID=UPI00258D262B|nr:FHA domain-containing protein At4g14490-like [Lotus japonicus]
MEPPSLTLRILQGPPHCKGQTHNFKPGSAIRIGRVIRGNTLPIKDPGISSKHLNILTESGQWVLRDLDTSNGTVLNGSNVLPQTPFPLHDGSTIKIGELTSILVNLLHPIPTEPVTVPEAEGSEPPVAKPGRGRRGKGLKGKVAIHENASVDVGDESGFVGRPESNRVTRNTKNNRSVVGVSGSSVAGDLGAAEEKVAEPKNTRSRAALGSKNKRSVIEIVDLSSGNSDDAPEEKVEEQKNSRVTRNLKESEASSLQIGVVEPRITRVTRNLKNKQSVIGVGDSVQASSLQVGVENVEKKKTRGGGRRKKLPEECTDGGGKETEKENLNGDGKETCDGREKENLNGDDNLPDLEKLSLGEWFDFLEVHLPKQIVDATEEMFGSMRQKAERLREYIIMQKIQEVTVPVE